MIERKNVIGLVIACLSLSICMYMRLRVSYMHNLDTINNKLIDSMLLTVDDFTVSGKLAPEIYQDYLKTVDDLDNLTMAHFEKLIIAHIEKQMTALLGEIHIFDV
jgi:hypothetical protein